MRAKQLHQLVEIMERDASTWSAETALLLTLLEEVAETAAAHLNFDLQFVGQDGEMDALAILDTLRGESSLRMGPRP